MNVKTVKMLIVFFNTFNDGLHKRFSEFRVFLQCFPCATQDLGIIEGQIGLFFDFVKHPIPKILLNGADAVTQLMDFFVHKFKKYNISKMFLSSEKMSDTMADKNNQYVRQNDRH